MLARRIKDPAPVLDGLVELPAGKIAAVATYLEIFAPRSGLASRERALDEVGSLEPIGHDLARYRRLYAEIGEAWLWFSRALMDDAALAQIIRDPAVEPVALVMGGRNVGLLELDFRAAGECELAFFGLVADMQGRGLGRVLLREAVRRAFARPIRRLWLHTCTLDHPAAVQTYLQAGFVPYRRAIEIADDPRLTGHMPVDAAPHFPALR